MGDTAPRLSIAMLAQRLLYANADGWEIETLSLPLHIALITESENIFRARAFSRNPGAIKIVGIESIDIGLFKKSNESF